MHVDRRRERVLVAHHPWTVSLSPPAPSGIAPTRFASAVAVRTTGARLGGMAVLALVYYGSARVGDTLGFSGAIASIVWLPVGVGAAFLTIGGLSFWPGALIGDLLANDYSHLPFSGQVGQTAGNLLEVLVIAVIVRRLVRRGSPLESLGSVA